MIKDIELCGIGNGLVDLQLEISFKQLEELKLNKGEMRLVDSGMQSDIISKLGALSFNKCSGGSAANTIIAFSKFGGKAAYKTSLGNDEFGKFYSSEFMDLGIELHAPIDDELPTGSCLVLITPDSERTMNTCLGASSVFSKNFLKEEVIKRSGWLYIEGYEFATESGTEAVFESVELAKKYDTRIAVTFSDVFITSVFPANLKKVVEQSDLIFCNEAEAMNFTNEKDVTSAFKMLGDFCPNVVLTQGSKGSLIKYNNQAYVIPSYPVKAVDSTGAGDMFAAGFLFGIIKNGNPEIAGKLGSYSASRVVSQFGARLSEDHKAIYARILEGKI